MEVYNKQRSSSDQETSSSSSKKINKPALSAVAIKSTAMSNNVRDPPQSTSRHRRRRQAAKERKAKALADAERSAENVDSDRSLRDKKKGTKKTNSNIRRPPGALYDEMGRHIASGLDLCDCLNKNCCGCHFPCPKCQSLKCGSECRVHRKYTYDSIEYMGSEVVVPNPLTKRK